MRFVDRYNPFFHVAQSVEAALWQAAADKAGTGKQWLVRLVGSSAELFAAEMEVMRPDARSLAA